MKSEETEKVETYKRIFGDLVLAVDLYTGEEVAAKVEQITARHMRLLHEHSVYLNLQGGVGIPKTRWFGLEGGFRVLVMDLLGPNALRLEFIHSRGFVHRDVKPDNFPDGDAGVNEHKVYVVDFGLRQTLPGGRRDDLESLAYILFYFNRGTLPWQGLKAATKRQKYDMISERKLTTSSRTLAAGLPEELSFTSTTAVISSLTKTRTTLTFGNLFLGVFKQFDLEYDFLYDWAVDQKSQATVSDSPHLFTGISPTSSTS
ncbi:hypothetical protein LAZ67_18002380 [Cordylochernes scorpioides]|uniref:Protein kinase domain-containing protein n=1 Tax=Cordylochernes scorpioides TaxID=51811 RepID=A0ABY6LHI3_9ARAC|nr:hypothetical protein LAZ67_18002380 [Cordylochernes scorpioides]